MYAAIGYPVQLWTNSVLCLWTEMNEALKPNSDCGYCITEDDKTYMYSLWTAEGSPAICRTDRLDSSGQPHLGLIPLIITEVKRRHKVRYGWKLMCHFTGSSYSTAFLHTASRWETQFELQHPIETSRCSQYVIWRHEEVVNWAHKTGH